MSKSRLEIKVGLFVLVGLVLLAVLLLQFSKGTSFFRPTRTIYLTTESAGGLKKRASVLMSGVPIGFVSDIRLAPDGKAVSITLRIFQDYTIRQDAEFLIKQSGFLGDNYVAIHPGENRGEEFPDPGYATAVEPFDLQEVARTAAGFIRRVEEAAADLNEVISDVRRLMLNERTLTDVATTVSTMRSASERALSAATEFEQLLEANSPAVSVSASNIVHASGELARFTDTLNTVLITNTESISAAVKNVETSTVVLKTLLENAQAGRGLAGALLQNEELSENVANIVSDLSITSSNLNRLGLWRGVLFPRRPREASQPPARLTTPGSPFD